MRKDGKQQYIVKKEKLLTIKRLLKEGYMDPWEQIRHKQTPTKAPLLASELAKQIWEIVKNEK